MNIIEQWLNDIKCVPEVNTKNWQAFNYTYSLSTLSKNDIAQELFRLGDVSGYLTLTHEIKVYNDEALKFEGNILSGEFYQNKKHWIIRYASDGKWSLHYYHLTNCENNLNEANCLIEPVVHLRNALSDSILKQNKAKKLKFYRLWEPSQSAIEKDAPICKIALLNHIEF